MNRLLDLSPSLQWALMVALHSSNIWLSDTYPMSTSTFASIETLALEIHILGILDEKCHDLF